MRTTPTFKLIETILVVPKSNNIVSKSFNRLIGNLASKISQLKLEGCAIKAGTQKTIYATTPAPPPPSLPP